ADRCRRPLPEQAQRAVDRALYGPLRALLGLGGQDLPRDRVAVETGQHHGELGATEVETDEQRCAHRRSAAGISSPCASMSSSHIATISRVVSVALVFGSSSAAW